MFDEMLDWLQAAIGDEFRIADGGFPDGPQFATNKMCVVKGMGGPAPDVDDRNARYKIILLGPARDRAQVAAVRAAAEAIMQAILTGAAPCGAAGIRAMGEPIGPSYTAEDRAWMSVDLQLMY